METIIDNNFINLNSNKSHNNNLNSNKLDSNNSNGTTMLNNLIPFENTSNINGATKLENLNNEDNMKNELKSFFTNLNDI